MGCYNLTCMISNLPIFRGDKVYAGFMTYNPWEWKAIHDFDTEDDWRGHHWSGGATSETTLFIPRSMPVFGKYDEYGGITIAPESKGRLSTRVTCETFEEDIVVRKTSLDNYSNMPKLEATPYNIDDLFKRAQLGALHVKYGGNGKVVPVAQWMVKASVYDAMREAARLDTCKRWWSDDHNNQYTKERDFFVDAARKDWYGGDLIALSRALFDLTLDFSVFKEYFGFVTPNAGSFTRWAEKNKATPEQVAELFDEVKGFMDFIYAMRLGRYMFLPVSGRGSQDRGMFIQQVVAKVALESSEPNGDDDEE